MDSQFFLTSTDVGENKYFGVQAESGINGMVIGRSWNYCEKLVRTSMWVVKNFKNSQCRQARIRASPKNGGTGTGSLTGGKLEVYKISLY